MASVMHRCNKPVESRSALPKMMSSAMSATRNTPSKRKLSTANEIEQHLHNSDVLLANLTCRGTKSFLEANLIFELMMLQFAPVSRRPWSVAVGSFGLLVSMWILIRNNPS